MSFELTDREVEVRDAATVMLVRDGARGIEVGMLRRNGQSIFVADAYVFPGGAVDHEDANPELEQFCRGRTDAEASAFLGLRSGGLPFWVAAIRECFEEAGVLLAYGPDGRIVDRHDPSAATWFGRHRRAVDGGHRELLDLCREEDLTLATDRLLYFSTWVTPRGAPRRYNTRFFVAAAPPGQDLEPDGVETVAHAWVRPDDALSRNRAGGFELILPTMRSLEAIRGFDSVAELLGAAEEATIVAVGGG